MHSGKNKFKALREQISGHLSLFVSRYRIFEEGGGGKKESFSRKSWQFLARGIIRGEEKDTVCRARVASPAPANIHPRRTCGGKGEQNGDVVGLRGRWTGRGRPKRWIKKHEWKRNACWLSHGLCQPFVTSRDRGAQLVLFLLHTVNFSHFTTARNSQTGREAIASYATWNGYNYI